MEQGKKWQGLGRGEEWRWLLGCIVSCLSKIPKSLQNAKKSFNFQLS